MDSMLLCVKLSPALSQRAFAAGLRQMGSVEQTGSPTTGVGAGGTAAAAVRIGTRAVIWRTANVVWRLQRVCMAANAKLCLTIESVSGGISATATMIAGKTEQHIYIQDGTRIYTCFHSEQSADLYHHPHDTLLQPRPDAYSRRVTRKCP